MEKVGIRELKENLSKYLKKTQRSGEKIIVTDRKREVAVLVPMGLGPEEERLFQLKNRGLLDWSGEKPKGLTKRVPVKGKNVSQVLLEDRR